LKNVNFNSKFLEISQAIWEATWAKNRPGFECPYAPFPTNSGYTLLEPLGCRLPSSLLAPEKNPQNKVQKNLDAHVDINPWKKWEGFKGNIRWKPLQGFISLTENTGGFECYKGFHTQFDKFFSTIPMPHGHDQCFLQLQAPHYQEIVKNIKPISCNPGDAVIWDWRIPHQTSKAHTGTDTREVVYASCLPNVPCNQGYIRKQLAAYQKGEYPPEHNKKGKIPAYQSHERMPRVPRQDHFYLDEFQKSLLGMK